MFIKDENDGLSPSEIQDLLKFAVDALRGSGERTDAMNKTIVVRETALNA